MTWALLADALATVAVSVLLVGGTIVIVGGMADDS